MLVWQCLIRQFPVLLAIPPVSMFVNAAFHFIKCGHWLLNVATDYQMWPLCLFAVKLKYGNMWHFLAFNCTVKHRPLCEDLLCFQVFAACPPSLHEALPRYTPYTAPGRITCVSLFCACLDKPVSRVQMWFPLRQLLWLFFFAYFLFEFIFFTHLCIFYAFSCVLLLGIECRTFFLNHVHSLFYLLFFFFLSYFDTGSF